MTSWTEMVRRPPTRSRSSGKIGSIVIRVPRLRFAGDVRAVPVRAVAGIALLRRRSRLLPGTKIGARAEARVCPDVDLLSARAGGLGGCSPLLPGVGEPVAGGAESKMVGGQ